LISWGTWAEITVTARAITTRMQTDLTAMFSSGSQMKSGHIMETKRVSSILGAVISTATDRI
jgi:hypothetical protein